MTSLLLDVVSRREDSAAPPARAWLLPGGSPDRWIRGLADVGLARGDVGVFFVPGPRSTREAVALLVVPDAGVVPSAPWPEALPLVRCGTRVLIPRDGALTPPLLDAECDALFPDGWVLVHPAFGCVVFEAADRRTVVDLLEAPAVREGDWGVATTGPVPSERLTSIAPRTAPSAIDVMRQLQKETPTKPPTEIPKPPDRRRRHVDEGLKKRLARWVLRFTDRVPRTAPRRNWINRLEDWANLVLRRNLRDERTAALDRLLDLLKRDPDAGIRYAIPIEGDAPRGAAPPSSRLARRDADFRLSRVNRSGPKDVWDVDARRRAALRYSYLRHAERCLADGRFREAAYVYAELLGDHRSAAQALARGGYAREAAVIFRDRLGEFAEAARCLESAGLLEEAIADHERAGNHRRVGELLVRLDRPTEARVAFRRAVDAALADDAPLRAAEILEVDLQAPDEALELLDRFDVSRAHAEACLKASFALLARLGRHGETARRILSAANASPRGVARTRLVQIVGEIAARHVDSEVRATASDAVRVIVGREFAADPGADVDMLRVVAALRPDDPVLSRDVARFAKACAARPWRLFSRSGKGDPAFAIQKEFTIPPPSPATAAILVSGAWLFVYDTLAHRRGHAIDVWSLEGGLRARRVALMENTIRWRGWLACVQATGMLRVVLGCATSPFRIPLQSFKLPDDTRVRLGIHPYAPNGAICGCADGAGGFVFLSSPEAGEVLVTWCTAEGNVVKTALLTDERLPAEGSIWQVVATRDAVVLLTPGSVHCVTRSGVTTDFKDVGPAVGAVVSPPPGPQRLVLLTPNGCVSVTGLANPDFQQRLFATRRNPAHATFTRNGVLVVADDLGLAAYQESGELMVECGRDHGVSVQSVFGLQPGPHADDVTVVRFDGTVTVRRVPRRPGLTRVE